MVSCFQAILQPREDDFTIVYPSFKFSKEFFAIYLTWNMVHCTGGIGHQKIVSQAIYHPLVYLTMVTGVLWGFRICFVLNLLQHTLVDIERFQS